MLFRPRLSRRRARSGLAYYYQRPVLWVLLVLFLLDAWHIAQSRGVTIRVPAPAEEVAVGDATGETAGKPQKALRASSSSLSAAPTTNTSVFIVSVHRNTEKILRAAWVDALLKLVDHLGRDNVYVSAVESGSQDDTKGALTDLQRALASRGVAHTVDLGATVWEQLDELNAWPAADATAANGRRPSGWIWHAAEGHYALRRIPYLARVRNQAMAPLLEVASQKTGGRRFDRVLWINDVAFDTSDVLTLLDTRGGRYAAACAMDFKEYPYYYDTFALRDARGDKAVSPHWPWFREAGARADVRAGRPVRVQSCWNGMVAFDAAPFYGSSSPTQAAASPASPATTTPPLLFRGVDDSLAEHHLEASECCLIHADNPLSGWTDTGAADDDNDDDTDDDANAPAGVWLNPNVRVAYSVPVYDRVRVPVFPGVLAAVRGEWANRWERALSRVQFALEGKTVRERLAKWAAAAGDGGHHPAAPEEARQARREPGAACLINEMQIMWQNGWKHL